MPTLHDPQNPQDHHGSHEQVTTRIWKVTCRGYDRSWVTANDPLSAGIAHCGINYTCPSSSDTTHVRGYNKQRGANRPASAISWYRTTAAAVALAARKSRTCHYWRRANAMCFTAVPTKQRRWPNEQRLTSHSTDNRSFLRSESLQATDCTDTESTLRGACELHRRVCSHTIKATRKAFTVWWHILNPSSRPTYANLPNSVFF